MYTSEKERYFNNMTADLTRKIMPLLCIPEYLSIKEKLRASEMVQDVVKEFLKEKEDRIKEYYNL